MGRGRGAGGGGGLWTCLLVSVVVGGKGGGDALVMGMTLRVYESERVLGRWASY